MSHTTVVKRRINQVIAEIDAQARKLSALCEELPAPEPAELEEMLAERRPFSYEALLVGLLGSMSFHLTEATVSLWGEGYSRYRPSTFNGEINDLQIRRVLKNRVEQRARD